MAGMMIGFSANVNISRAMHVTDHRSVVYCKIDITQARGAVIERLGGDGVHAFDSTSGVRSDVFYSGHLYMHDQQGIVAPRPAAAVIVADKDLSIANLGLYQWNKILSALNFYFEDRILRDVNMHIIFYTYLIEFWQHPQFGGNITRALEAIPPAFLPA